VTEARRHAALALSLLAALPVAAQVVPPQPEAATGREEKQAVFAPRHMVVAANPLASDAGLEILRAGGSAVDAAIATQMVLGLVEPQSSGIGGGAFLLHWSRAGQRVRSYDGRETAPQAARPDRFLDAVRAAARTRRGDRKRPLRRRAGRRCECSSLRTVATAGCRGVALSSPRSGSPSRGFRCRRGCTACSERESALRNDAAARILYYDNDRAKPVGTLIVNTEYAATLRSIARSGAKALHSGPIARDIVRAVGGNARPGDLTLDDLAKYRAVERAPVCGRYRIFRVCSMAPPSAGGIAVLQILGILERTAFASAPPNSADAVHYFAEAGRLAYADRARYIADPAFVAQPVAELLSPRYLEERSRLVGERSMGRAQPGAVRIARALQGEGTETEIAGTSHVSIVDGRGDAVALSTTIEDAFGSRILVRGFLLNNQLTDFSFVPQSDGRTIAIESHRASGRAAAWRRSSSLRRTGACAWWPARPAGLPSSITWRKRSSRRSTGSSTRRLRHRYPNFGSRNGPTEVERATPYELLAPALRERGHEVQAIEFTSGLHLIERVKGGWRGGADPRREGAARGD
jgi:gamma-glutamyltranspeptidase/glutathione hydrolase